jgi:hypothetical protein
MPSFKPEVKIMGKKKQKGKKKQGNKDNPPK